MLYVSVLENKCECKTVLSEPERMDEIIQTPYNNEIATTKTTNTHPQQANANGKNER